jgi:hypothetical protein
MNLQQDKSENIPEITKSDFENAVDKELEKNNLSKNNVRDTIIIAIVFASYSLISVPHTNNIIVSLIITFILIINTVFIVLFFWNLKRFYKRVEIIKSKGWKVIVEFSKRLDVFGDKISGPLGEYKLNQEIPILAQLIKENRITKKEAEKILWEKANFIMQDIYGSISEWHQKLFQYEIKEAVMDTLDKPLENERFNIIKNKIDYFTFRYRFYFSTISIVLSIIYLLYVILTIWNIEIFNFW